MSNIKEILSKNKTIAMIGVSKDLTKPSTIVMKYMQKYGYKIVPVNPKAKGEKILGEEVFGKLDEIKIPIDSFSIMEAWNSKKLNEIRKMHKSNSRTKIDPGCKNCHHGHKKSGYTKIPETWSSGSMAWKTHKTLSEKRKYKQRKGD